MKKITVLLVISILSLFLVSMPAFAADEVVGVAPGVEVGVNPEGEITTAAPAETAGYINIFIQPLSVEERMEQAAADLKSRFPYSEELAAYSTNMDYDFQYYIWGLANSHGLDDNAVNYYYAWLIGLAEGEHDFQTGSRTYHTNGNGSVDRGMFQTNSCWVKKLKKMGWINSSEDLYDKYISAKCGDWYGWIGYSIYGWDIGSYSAYLYGDTSRVRTNKYTKRVWNLQQKWYDIIFNQTNETE